MTKSNKAFSQWLLSEITAQGMSYSEVARRGRISHARISQVIAGEEPGKRFCKGIARALKVPVEEVFRRAGILPPQPEHDEHTETLLFLFRNLSVEDQERLLAMMRGLAESDRRKGGGDK